jgi:hypothetical protein
VSKYRIHGFRGTYVGVGGNPVDGCRESEKADDGNHCRPRGELEVLVYILSLKHRVHSAGIKEFGRRMLTMVFHRSIAGSCYRFPEG